MAFDYLVVGAGFAGAVIAERIATVLGKRVHIIEKRAHVGGNCFDEVDNNGIRIHRYGPHLFHTDSEEVVEYLSSFTEWEPYEHEVLAAIGGKKVPVPFNLNSIEMTFSPEVAKLLETKLVERYGFGKKVPILELRETDDEDLKRLSRYIYENVFLNYTIKQWGMRPEEIDLNVTARVPVHISRDNRYFQDAFQKLPREGYSAIFEKLLESPLISLSLNTSFEELLSVDGEQILFQDAPFEGKVIFTGMIDELFGRCYGALPYRSLQLGFETVEQEWYQERAVVNYPNDFAFTRITEFKHMHRVTVPRTTILKEYPEPFVSGENIPYYPLFTFEDQKRYELYAQKARTVKNLVLVGRLAEYRYYDMDDIVARALEVFETEVRRDAD
jgi:UDP-galactopyranose mutase